MTVIKRRLPSLHARVSLYLSAGALGLASGCYQHHTVDESDFAPSTSEDPIGAGGSDHVAGDGDDEVDNQDGPAWDGDGDAYGDGVDDGGDWDGGDDGVPGDDEGGDPGDGTDGGGLGGLEEFLPSEEECENADPNDVLTAVLCQVADAVAGGGGGDGGFDLPSEEDCENVDPEDIVTQLLCQVVQGGGGGGIPGFPGGGNGGFPGGGNGGFPGGGDGQGDNGDGQDIPSGLPTEEECADVDPSDQQMQWICDALYGDGRN